MERYIRNIKIIGEKGQEKLANSKVAIAGLGGLGTVAAYYLALAGVGSLTLIDRDVVESHNLNRQLLFSETDIDKPKVLAFSERLKPFYSGEIRVVLDDVKHYKVTADVVLDCLDNLQDKLWLNRACALAKRPLIYGGAVGWQGVVFTVTPKTACVECLFGEKRARELLQCEGEGILGPTVGVIGSLQAAEAIKVLTGKKTGNQITYLDLLNGTFQIVAVKKNKRCSVCGSR